MQGLQRIEEAEKTMNNGLQPYSWYDHLKIFEAGGSLAKVSCHSIQGHSVLVIRFLDRRNDIRILKGFIKEQAPITPIPKSRDSPENHFVIY